MTDIEYSLFTTEDPIKLLKKSASSLPIHKRFKIAPIINKSKALTKKAKPFRDIILDETTPNGMLIGYMFASYFGEKIDKHKYLSIPKDTAMDFLIYLGNSGIERDDKYMRKVVKLIVAHSESIEAFIMAFLSIRQAQGELNKLQTA